MEHADVPTPSTAGDNSDDRPADRADRDDRAHQLRNECAGAPPDKFHASSQERQMEIDAAVEALAVTAQAEPMGATSRWHETDMAARGMGLPAELDILEIHASGDVESTGRFEEPSFNEYAGAA
jgi:hypothetical protein